MGEQTMAEAQAQAQQVAGQFLQHFYGLFDSDRSQLAPMFTEASQMHFEGAHSIGQTAIMGKMTNLSFQKVQHDLTTARLDCQVSLANGIYIMVTGVLSVDGGPPLPFADSFILQQNGTSWYIHNYVFRMNVA